MIRCLLIVCLVTSFVSNAPVGKLDKIRGVNLGGWLVLEPWIRPSLFKQFENAPREKIAIDETTFHTKLGLNETQKQLEEHWSTWVTEQDFKVLANWGINLVRIPFGWWILGEDAKYVSALHHLDRGIKLAAKYGIQVLLDLHGVPGSQNGFDNSGTTCAITQRTGKCATDCPDVFTWHKNKGNVEYTKHVLLTIARRYKNEPNIYGIELLNEPYFIDMNFMKQFYYDCYALLRPEIPQDWVIVMHDAFQSQSWEGFMSDKTTYKNVLIDTHIYFAFDNKIMTMPLDQVLKQPCTKQDQITFMINKQLPTVVGEFSLARDDCALYLRGFKQGSAKENELGLTCQYIYDHAFMTEFVRNQLYIWEQTNGWIFWNFKSELEDDWSFEKLISNGWVPKSAADIPDFISKSQCAQKKGLRVE